MNTKHLTKTDSSQVQETPKRKTDFIHESNWRLSAPFLQNYRVRTVQNAMGMFGQKLANHYAKQRSVVSIADGNHTIKPRLFMKQKKQECIDCARLNLYRNVIGIEFLLASKRKRCVRIWG